MNQPEMFEDSFEDSLRSLAPSLPPGTKSRLLFECGMAAAETKHRNRKRKLGVVSSVALLMATGLGFVLGSSFSNSSQPMAAASSPSVTEQDPLTYSVADHTGNTAMLAVAMPPSRALELIERIDSSKRSVLPEDPTAMKIPFGARSLSTEL